MRGSEGAAAGGQLLTEMKASRERAKPSDTLKEGKHIPSSRGATRGATLADLGVSRDQSSQWQAVKLMSSGATLKESEGGRRAPGGARWGVLRGGGSLEGFGVSFLEHLCGLRHVIETGAEIFQVLADLVRGESVAIVSSHQP